MAVRVSTARALANVALVKYFGKRDRALNLPAAGSLSVALEPPVPQPPIPPVTLRPAQASPPR